MRTRKGCFFLLLSFVLCCGWLYAFAQEKSAPSATPGMAGGGTAGGSGLQPGPEMQRLFDAFNGQWSVSERFEVSASQQGKAREGVARFRQGPGFSLIEDYKSDGTAGELNSLALLWWDKKARVYRLVTCANNDGCNSRGTLRWEGKALVNSWQETVDDKPATFRDSFENISPSAFRLVSEGTSGGKTIWRVVTEYKRVHGRR